MSNHYHIVIRIDPDQAHEWSDEEVARRWMQVFSGPLLLYQYSEPSSAWSSRFKLEIEDAITRRLSDDSQGWPKTHSKKDL